MTSPFNIVSYHIIHFMCNGVQISKGGYLDHSAQPRSLINIFMFSKLKMNNVDREGDLCQKQCFSLHSLYDSIG